MIDTPTPSSADVIEGMREALDKDTIQTLLELLNPLHSTLDWQTYDEKPHRNFDVPDSAEYTVNITSSMECDLTQAVLILENRLAALALPDSKPDKGGA